MYNRKKKKIRSTESKIYKKAQFDFYITRDFNFNEQSNTTEINILEYAFT